MSSGICYDGDLPDARFLLSKSWSLQMELLSRPVTQKLLKVRFNIVACCWLPSSDPSAQSVIPLATSVALMQRG